MASALDRAERTVISTLVHQSGKTSKYRPEKKKEINPRRLERRTLSLELGEPWDAEIGGDCAGGEVLLGPAGPRPVGSGDGAPSALISTG